MSAFLILLLSLGSPVRADLSFIQVAQAQSSRGKEGLFGKTWVELEGRRMRIVSGYAGKLRQGGGTEDPRRVIQILDLDQKVRFIIYPEKKSYSRAPLGGLDYDNRLIGGLRRGRPVMAVEILGVELAKQEHTRKILGVPCEHYRLRARLSLQAPDLKRREAHMDQDVWVAPINGPLSTTILELIAFENAYREAAGGALSPLDYERYQLREAAAYLQTPEEGLRRAVERVREKFRDLPGYPVASSVSWWLPEEPISLGSLREKKRKNTPKQEDPAVAVQKKLRQAGRPEAMPAYARGGRIRYQPPALPRFKAIDWRRSEKNINRMYSKTRNQFADNFLLGPLPPRLVKQSWPREPAIYRKFHKSMEETLTILAQPQRPKKAPEPPPPTKEAPFYEIYAELHGLQTASEVPQEDLAVPKNFTEIPYKTSDPAP